MVLYAAEPMARAQALRTPDDRTGVPLFVVVPSPSWPFELLPQA
jgi:hypothetical protein